MFALALAAGSIPCFAIIIGEVESGARWDLRQIPPWGPLEKSGNWDHSLSLLFSMASRDLISSILWSVHVERAPMAHGLLLMDHLEREKLKPDLVTMNLPWVHVKRLATGSRFLLVALPFWQKTQQRCPSHTLRPSAHAMQIENGS